MPQASVIVMLHPLSHGTVQNQRQHMRMLSFGRLLLPDLLQGFNADLLGGFTWNQYTFEFFDYDGKKWNVSFYARFDM